MCLRPPNDALLTVRQYQLFVMSANYKGQGGLFSLLSLLKWCAQNVTSYKASDAVLSCRSGNLENSPRLWRTLQAIAIVGVSLSTNCCHQMRLCSR